MSGKKRIARINNSTLPQKVWNIADAILPPGPAKAGAIRLLTINKTALTIVSI
jgi:hypothetical protein